jgi:hypothetical protein
VGSLDGTIATPPFTTREVASLAGYDRVSGLPRSASSNARSNFLIVKSGPGQLFGFTARSNAAAKQFILLFDLQAGAIPANGTIPVQPFDILATSTLGVWWGDTSRWFEQGIVLCNSSTDNSLTAGAADTWFDAQYA